MKFATGRTLMAPISSSTLIFTFCLTRELQIVVGTLRNSVGTTSRSKEHPYTRIVSENEETARGLYTQGIL